MNGTGLVLGFGAANLAWTIALLAAPLSLPSGTVQGLDGHANLIDHAERWAALPWFPRLVYAAGDLNCHQMAQRSWSLGGNQMPVDARMFSASLFGSAGFALALAGPGAVRYRDAAARIWPAPLRARLDTPARRLGAVWLAWTVALVPTLVDVLAQLFLPYESTNLHRLWTGALLGVVGAFLVGALLRSLAWSPSPAAAAA